MLPNWGLGEGGSPLSPPWPTAWPRTEGVESSWNGVVGVGDLRLGLSAAYFLRTSEGVTECSPSFFGDSKEGGILGTLLWLS